MAIDAIQRDVLTSRDLPAGNYALFAEQSENLFMPSVLFALDEYGIPIQTAQALRSVLTPAETLDDVLAKFRSLSLSGIPLSPFEFEVIAEVRETLFPTLSADIQTRWS
jgi:hypothetical protein